MGRKREINQMGKHMALEYGTCWLICEEDRLAEWVQWKELDGDYPWLTAVVGEQVLMDPLERHSARVAIGWKVHAAYLRSLDRINTTFNLGYGRFAQEA